MKKRNKLDIGSLLIESIWTIAGVLSAAFALNSFLLPNNFIDGGATGIALLIAETTVLDISYLILFVNIPFVIIGYLHMNKRFIHKTVITIAVLSVILSTVEFPIITEDPLLAAVFGGFFIGAGIGLCVRGGCVIDGTEIFALHFSGRLNVSIGDFIMIINVFIFLASAWLLGVEAALYSVMAYFVASKTMDFVIQGIEEYLGITIVSQKHDEIKQAIIDQMHAGVTIMNGSGGFGKTGDVNNEIQVLYTVVSRLELLKINRILDDVDPNAFVVIHGVREVKGGVLKRRVMPT